jgi:hypothetical protein
MAQGLALTEWQQNEIRAAWLVTRNGSYAARRAGVNPRTAQRYIANHLPELTALADEKAPEIAASLEVVARELVSYLMDSKKLADARLGEIATAFGIVVDKYQLLTGEATERHEHRDIDEARESVARRLDELAERRRAKGADLVADGTAGR